MGHRHGLEQPPDVPAPVEPPHRGTQLIGVVGVLHHVAGIAQGVQVLVRGALRQLQVRADLGQPEWAVGLTEMAEHRQRALHRSDQVAPVAPGFGTARHARQCTGRRPRPVSAHGTAGTAVPGAKHARPGRPARGSHARWWGSDGDAGEHALARPRDRTGREGRTDMTRHRIAILGCGGMEKSHQQVFGDLADRVEVVACVDPVQERAEQAAQALGAPYAVADHREVLDQVDCVLGVLPHHLPHPIGMDCLRAGKHVLMEKPLAITEQQCRELQAEAGRQGVTLMTGYPMRFHPLVIKLKELIDRRAYGPLFHLSIWTEQYTRYPEGHWGPSEATLGGGQFLSHGCHYVDLMLWMCGPPTSGVHVGSRLGTPWMEGEGTSDVIMSFANGVQG